MGGPAARRSTPAGSFNKEAAFPADGEHLLIDIQSTGIEWSLHSVAGHEAWCCGGNARFQQGENGERVLVLGAPSASGGSALLPGGLLNEDQARAYLADMMKALPDCPAKMVLPL